MQTTAKPMLFIAFSGPASLMNAVRLGSVPVLNHFDLPAFSIRITYGF
jgi:hypothetical protein